MEPFYIEYLNNNCTIETILRKYNITKSYFYRHMPEGLKELREKQSFFKYYYNINKFKQDSIDKYYWLGFIAADGSIIKNSLRIQLHVKDKEHLYKFKNFAETNTPIKEYYNNHNILTALITINNKPLIDYLKTYNILSNKSSNIIISPLIPQEYISHFIRGYFDGDGSIYIKNPGNQLGFAVVSGSKILIQQIKDFLNLDNKIIDYGNYYKISVAGNNKAKKIFDIIYKDSNENNRLSRKYEIYDNFIKHIDPLRSDS